MGGNLEQAGHCWGHERSPAQKGECKIGVEGGWCGISLFPPLRFVERFVFMALISEFKNSQIRLCSEQYIDGLACPTPIPQQLVISSTISEYE